MDKILLAFLTLRDKISALILDTNASVIRLAKAIELLRTKKAEQSEIVRLDTKTDATNAAVTALSNTVSTTVANVASLGNDLTLLNTKVDQTKADVTNLQLTVTNQGGTISTLEINLADLIQKVLNAGTKEFYFESTSSDPLDLATTLGEKAAEFGSTLVNQQYAINVIGAAAFTYPDVDGNMTVIELTNGGRILANYVDGLMTNVITIPTSEGGLVVPDIDVTTVTNTLDSNVDTELSSYFD